jgi:hypothetical protein
MVLSVVLRENAMDRIRPSTTARSTICPYNEVLPTRSKNHWRFPPSSLAHMLLLSPSESDSSTTESEFDRARNSQLRTVKAIFSVLVAYTVVTFANVISVG